VLPTVTIFALIVILISVFNMRRSTYSFRAPYRRRRREREAEASANLPPDPAFRLDGNDKDDGLGRI
jgi:uncharacterized protein HemY